MSTDIDRDEVRRLAGDATLVEVLPSGSYLGKDRQRLLVTTPEGQLIGVVARDEVERLRGEKGEA